MAFDGRLAVSVLSVDSAKIKLMLVLFTLVCQTCICTVPEASQINRMREATEESGNQLEEKGVELPSFGDDDLLAYKRHLGAIAAMSGSKQMYGSKSFIPPSKKHLGSIAAHSTGRAAGRRLELGSPTKLEMYKRHLGALRALTGYKPRPLTRSLKESPPYQIDPPTDTLELETPSVTYHIPDTDKYDDGISNSARYNFDSQEVQISPDIFLMNADEPTSLNEFQHMSLPRVDGGLNENMGSTELNEDDDDVVTYKSKRFLGPLARGGWFPRHFRGIVSENAFGKRHIGSLARLGWMPNAKGNGRLGMIMEDQRGDIGLKRNDMSPRRRMLYHFAAPSLWTSPRGK